MAKDIPTTPIPPQPYKHIVGLEMNIGLCGFLSDGSCVKVCVIFLLPMIFGQYVMWFYIRFVQLYKMLAMHLYSARIMGKVAGCFGFKVCKLKNLKVSERFESGSCGGGWLRDEGGSGVEGREGTRPTLFLFL